MGLVIAVKWLGAGPRPRMASFIGERMAQVSGSPKARDTVWASTMPDGSALMGSSPSHRSWRSSRVGLGVLDNCGGIVFNHG